MYPGFIYHWKRAYSCAGHARHVEGGDTVYASGRHGSGFGVRRPLRVMTHELDLDEEQVAVLAQIIDELRTERAQASVNEQRSVGKIAEAMQASPFDQDAVEQALTLRVQAAESLKQAVLGALERTHAMLSPDQRKRLAYLLRSGAITI